MTGRQRRRAGAPAGRGRAPAGRRRRRKRGGVAPSRASRVRAASAAVSSARIQQGYTVGARTRTAWSPRRTAAGRRRDHRQHAGVQPVTDRSGSMRRSRRPAQLYAPRRNGDGDGRRLPRPHLPGANPVDRARHRPDLSAIPAQNSSGNWVKVVQRLTVRLVFVRKPEIPLQGGLSANVKVDTHHRRTLGACSGPVMRRRPPTPATSRTRASSPPRSCGAEDADAGHHHRHVALPHIQGSVPASPDRSSGC